MLFRVKLVLLVKLSLFFDLTVVLQGNSTFQWHKQHKDGCLAGDTHCYGLKCQPKVGVDERALWIVLLRWIIDWDTNPPYQWQWRKNKLSPPTLCHGIMVVSLWGISGADSQMRLRQLTRRQMREILSDFRVAETLNVVTSFPKAAMATWFVPSSSILPLCPLCRWGPSFHKY